MKSPVRLAAAAAALFAFAPAAHALHGHPKPPARETILAPAPPESVGFSSARLQLLTDAMHEAVDRKAVAGIVTMLVRHGRVVSFDAYGRQNLATGAPMTRDSIFRMYSQTKPLTGAAMMILFEQGQWRVEDQVTKCGPECANRKVGAGLDRDGKPILQDPTHTPTMREWMTHTAGFGYGLGASNYVDQEFQAQHVLASNSLHEMIEKVAAIPLLYQPGTKWSYSIAVDDLFPGACRARSTHEGPFSQCFYGNLAATFSLLSPVPDDAAAATACGLNGDDALSALNRASAASSVPLVGGPIASALRSAGGTLTVIGRLRGWHDRRLQRQGGATFAAELLTRFVRAAARGAAPLQPGAALNAEFAAFAVVKRTRGAMHWRLQLHAYRRRTRRRLPLPPLPEVYGRCQGASPASASKGVARRAAWSDTNQN